MKWGVSRKAVPIYIYRQHAVPRHLDKRHLIDIVCLLCVLPWCLPLWLCWLCIDVVDGSCVCSCFQGLLGAVQECCWNSLPEANQLPLVRWEGGPANANMYTCIINCCYDYENVALCLDKHLGDGALGSANHAVQIIVCVSYTPHCADAVTCMCCGHVFSSVFLVVNC